MSQIESFILGLAVYVMEYRLLAAVSIVTTVLILWLLVKRYSENVRKVMHVYFAILNFYPLFLLAYNIMGASGNIEALRARAFELLGLTHIPEALFVDVEPLPWRIQMIFYLILFLLTVSGAILWLYDIKKKQNVYDYTKMPRWQRYLTLFLLFYGLTYVHAMMFGIILGGIGIQLFLMYGLYPCPVNLVFVAILAPLVPKVNKPLYVVTCLMAICGAFYNQMIGISVNLDALAVTPVGVYGLIMLWRSRRPTTD
jgi:hypothetical protein